MNYFRAGTGRGRVDFHHLSDFLAGNGNVRNWSLLYGDPGRDLSLKSFGLFMQDDFRATPRLTLNLGLRYDVTFPLKDAHNQLANYVPNEGVIQVGFESASHIKPTGKTSLLASALRSMCLGPGRPSCAQDLAWFMSNPRFALLPLAAAD